MRQTSRQHGFTLVELIVVIGIISLLAVALTPAISRAIGASDDGETHARLERLKTAISKFEGENGFYPPDDFVDMQDAPIGVKAKTDSVNSGIESLVMFLCWRHQGGTDLTEHEDWLSNTDGDMNTAAIPLLDRKDKVEVADAWGTPFAYFHNRNYKKRQMVRRGGEGGDDVTVYAAKHPETGKVLGKRSYQLISAGADLEFGTDDDITHPAMPTN